MNLYNPVLTNDSHDGHTLTCPNVFDKILPKKCYFRGDCVNIEMMGVEFVRLAIAKTDYLVPHINDNDREPSWDGDVEVYRKAGNTHSKADLILKVPVQVKGRIESNLKKQSITYPVELSDLRNYLNAGGTTFLVVYVDEEGERSQIYYSNLLPFELKRLVSKHGEQKTKNIELKALPKKKSDIVDVFLFAARHMIKQRPAISCDPISMEDLVKLGRVPELTFSYTCTPDSNSDPLDYMFNHGTYLYAKLPWGLELPIEHLSHVDFVGTTIDAPVRANGRVFYAEHEVIQSKNTVEYHFGNCIKLVDDRSCGTRKFTFHEEGTLSQRITAADFMLNAIEAGQFEAGDNVYPFNAIKPDELAAFNIPERKSHLTWLKKVKSMLEKIGVTDDLDCDSLSKEDEALIGKLVLSVLHGRSVEWDANGEYFPEVTLANQRIKLCALKDEQNQGLYRIYGYSDAPVGFVMRDNPQQQTDVSYHVFLKRDAMLRCSNIDYTAVVNQIKTIPVSSEYSNALVWLLLEMLSAYDESDGARQDILKGATELADWLRHEDPYTPQDLLDLNYYQAVKRSRELTAREIQGLFSIVESKPARRDVYVGAYSLLGDYASAQYHYDGMEEEERKVFDSYPISHFLSRHRSTKALSVVEELSPHM